MVFLLLRWESGIYARVTVGMALQNSVLSDVRNPVSLRGAHRDSLGCLAGQ